MKSWVHRLLGVTLGIGATASIFGAQGCLDRPAIGIVPGGSGVTSTKIRVQRVDKVDLLLVVDNSISMGDKQSELGRRMPQLVKALTDPDDPGGGKPKPQGVADIHVGVITSSLGSHGTGACDPVATGVKRNNDQGHLLPRVGEPGPASGYTVKTENQPQPDVAACPAPVVASAISWVFDPAKDLKARFKGQAEAVNLQAATSCVVASALQDGCGYEETLEAMYHFLIDPAPYQKAEVKCVVGGGGDSCGTNKIKVEGVDNDLLSQRAQFLRKDSLLAVVILTDENDASLKPADFNWLPWGFAQGGMQRGWTDCAKVPDDFEPETQADYDKLHDPAQYNCWSCFEKGGDANCGKPWSAVKLNSDIDGRNNREFNQVQRFGYNFYYGRQRYVDAFTKPSVPCPTGMCANPIFLGGFRTTDLVIVATITGVPKRLIEDSSGKTKALSTADWDKIVGPIGTRDAHMIASIAPRAGIPKFIGDRNIDLDNGGDRDIESGDDLQYACIAPRTTSERIPNVADCEASDSNLKNPLCGAGSTQPYFKGYPGLRQLRIVRDLRDVGFVASICNNTYKNAIAGIVEKLQAALSAQCLKNSLEQDPTGNVNCLIVESFAGPTVVNEFSPDKTAKSKCEDIGKGYCTPGATPCRIEGSDYPPLSPAQAAAQLNLKIQVVSPEGIASEQKAQAVEEGGSVYVYNEKDPTQKHLVCEMEQLAGGRVSPAEANSCRTDENYKPVSNFGWCYTKEPKIVGDACRKVNAVGKIRFFGDPSKGPMPRNGSEVFTICLNTSTKT